MYRPRAVRSLLVEDIAGLPRPAEGTTPSETADRERSSVSRAGRRALIVAGVDLAALLVLYLFRDAGRPFLGSGASEEGLFTLGLLAVAVHAGYRLAQWRHLATVARLHDELVEREGADNTGAGDE